MKAGPPEGGRYAWLLPLTLAEGFVEEDGGGCGGV